MSSEKDLIIIKGGNTFQRISRKTFKAMPRRLWREETPKRSASRSKLSVDKKIKKIDKTNKLRTDQKSSKRRQQQQQQQEDEQSLIEVPNPPHNTTQYLISTNADSLDSQNLYTQNDRFEYDFQNHAMAGSMMDLMRDKFMHMFDQSTTAPSQGAQDTPLEDRQGFEEDFVEDKEEVNPYSVFLKQAETGENLQDLVKQLVGVLVQKDQEIGDLQASLSILNTEKR